VGSGLERPAISSYRLALSLRLLSFGYVLRTRLYCGTLIPGVGSEPPVPPRGFELPPSPTANRYNRPAA